MKIGNKLAVAMGINPCTFCESHNEIVLDSYSGCISNYIRIACDNCKSNGPKTNNLEDAIVKWNTTKEGRSND